jgi:hypothetical protein
VNPTLKITLIIGAVLVLSLIAAVLYEFLTWPRAEDEPTNKDYDEL